MSTDVHLLPKTYLAKSPHWYTPTFDMFFVAKWIARPNSEVMHHPHYDAKADWDYGKELHSVYRMRMTNPENYAGP